MVKTLDIQSGLEVSRNAFWLLGLKDDFYTIQQVKQTACIEDKIPIIVFFMHPSQGLALDSDAGHYMPDRRIGKKIEVCCCLGLACMYLQLICCFLFQMKTYLNVYFNENELENCFLQHS